MAMGMGMGMGVDSGGGSSGASADSYIGSLISLTSKSEIRYEGLLFNINTLESSIALRNVRSFGTEGRKKDGPQILPNEKVYEYILFRGSDIKDLQVKSSPPVQPSPPINNDPAIIQSHYPRPPSTSTTFPSPVSVPPTDISPLAPQVGANFQGGLPLYQQPGSNMGPWGPSPPPHMPMYWQGYNNYPQNGLSQQSFPRPPPNLIPPLQQPIQYLSLNPSLPVGTTNFPGLSLPEAPSPLLPSTTSSLNNVPTSQSNLLPMPSMALSTENFQSSIPNKPVNSILSTPPLSSNLHAVSSLTSSSINAHQVAPPPPISDKSKANSVSTLSYPIMSQPISSSIGVRSTLKSPIETSTPSLVTPGQLLQSAPASVSAPQQLETVHKDVEIVEVSSSSIKTAAPVAIEAQPPLLPLPQSSRPVAHKPNGTPFQGRPAYRGRGRGRGPGFSRSNTKFTEDFDFTAMNEKFNKDEVWGHLGKSNRSQKEGEEGSDEDDYEDEDYSEDVKVEAKPVYNKDDFFDSISSNALDRESNAGRIRFSEQRKIDTETFGDFSRYHGGRGGHWNGRGGRYRGSYRGRGGYGGGYSGRGGGGRGMSNRDY